MSCGCVLSGCEHSSGVQINNVDQTIIGSGAIYPPNLYAKMTTGLELGDVALTDNFNTTNAIIVKPTLIAPGVFFISSSITLRGAEYQVDPQTGLTWFRDDDVELAVWDETLQLPLTFPNAELFVTHTVMTRAYEKISWNAIANITSGKSISVRARMRPRTAGPVPTTACFSVANQCSLSFVRVA